jgi:hypothetical protein
MNKMGGYGLGLSGSGLEPFCAPVLTVMKLLDT